MGGDAAAGARLVERGQSRDRLLTAVTTLLDAGARAGTVRSDVAPADVMASLSGVSLAASIPELRDQASRVLDLIMDGLRYRAALPGPA